MDIDTARRVLKESEDTVSSIYVEADDPGKIEEVATKIEDAIPGIDARSMEEFSANFGRLLGQLDLFLMLIVSLALLVGVVGIINTMLMSTTERFSEFGILRTNGWSQRDVLTLVTVESAYLGLLAGLLGCAPGPARHGDREPVHHGRPAAVDYPVADRVWDCVFRSSWEPSAASIPRGERRGSCRWRRSVSGRID